MPREELRIISEMHYFIFLTLEALWGKIFFDCIIILL